MSVFLYPGSASLDHFDEPVEFSDTDINIIEDLSISIFEYNAEHIMDDAGVFLIGTADNVDGEMEPSGPIEGPEGFPE